MSIRKNNLITTLPFIGKEYKISFDLFVSKFQVSGYGVLFISPPVAIMKIWIINKKLRIVSPVNGNHNINEYQYTYPTVLKEGKWTNVEVSQTLVGDMVSKQIKLFGLHKFEVL